MKAFKPKGVEITSTHNPNVLRCSIKSKGRLGAAARARFVQLPEASRQRVLRAWFGGQQADLSV